ncbi:hypothetical protein QOT17_015047 [Balamuthia mandrillaris]
MSAAERTRKFREQQKKQVLSRFIPTTPKHRELAATAFEDEPATFSRTGYWQLKEDRGGYAVVLLIHAVRKELCTGCSKDIEELAGQLPKQYKKKTNREEQVTVRLGWWSRYRKSIVEVKGTSHPLSKKWLNKHKPIFEKVASHLKQQFPELFARYMEVNVEVEKASGKHNPFAPFATIVINVNFCVSAHLDKNDYRGGVTAILVLGTFTDGGALVLPELNIRIEAKPGDLIFFNGFDIKHKVEPYFGGTRYSIVFFCHHDMLSFVLQ